MLRFLDLYDPEEEEIFPDVEDYLIKLYLVVERVYEVLEVVGLLREECPKDGRGKVNFRFATEGMSTLRDIKQWANFIKHPNAFLWCHEPTHHSLSLGNYDEVPDVLIIDQKVVNKHYVKTESKQKELYKKITSDPRPHVVVVYPDLVDLTRKFCKGVRDFVDTVTSPMFAGFLKKRSTIEDYFEKFDEEETADC